MTAPFFRLFRHEGLQLLHALLLLLIGQVRVDVQDHLFIRVTHPALRCLQVDAGLVEHGAVGVPEIMAADIDLPVWRERPAGGQQCFMLPGLADPSGPAG